MKFTLSLLLLLSMISCNSSTKSLGLANIDQKLMWVEWSVDTNLVRKSVSITSEDAQAYYAKLITFSPNYTGTIDYLAFTTFKDDEMKDQKLDVILFELVKKRLNVTQKYMDGYNRRYKTAEKKWYQLRNFLTHFLTVNSRPTLPIQWSYTEDRLILFSDSLNFKCEYLPKRNSKTMKVELYDPISAELDYCPTGLFREIDSVHK